ncbi:alpha/beta hydrolase [Schleiferilactobacillus harbinensis]|uniref:alpha/beta hydrolase n=1 Tax=Schleiferilactobacillus harbinensis TaxID=304207 RepID=UPI002672B885|nr:alpha/beta hydrolase [Schleiferilactobacillus harbinensis]
MQEINQTLTEPAFFKGFVHAPNPEIKRTKYPAIMIVPGGSYTHIPEHQAEDLALAFFARGFQAFYLRYHFIGEKTPLLPSPVYDLGQALANIRDHADEWAVDPSQIVVAGFSVGGQVVSLYDTMRSEDSFAKDSGIAEPVKPKAVILGYSVTRLDDNFPPQDKIPMHQLTDDVPSTDARNHNVAQASPTFIWNTVTDNVISPLNSLDYATSLVKNNVSVELHTFVEGPHGLALSNVLTAWRPGTDLPHVAHWVPLALEWLRYLGIDTIPAN